MSNLAIKAENVSKLYRLGAVGTGTLGDDLTRFWAQLRGKEDPFSKIATSNDRSKKSNSDFVWSLQNIDFEIKKGDAVGIIGRNGAGKSTLLKVLSRITSPTTGRVRIDGRVASLLEVGTGFSPDLTGRQNIYMNGAILGMTRAEVSAKMDEIIDFSGVEGYIDTPVKRYSSGMYVRLAFAVAAHLEPEILIVDEVLAVGDAEFQKKCLGKMQDVNKSEGRTVLFVSHNIGAIKVLCKSSIFLENGQVKYYGDVATGIAEYNSSGISKSFDSQYSSSKASSNPFFSKIELFNEKRINKNVFEYSERVFFELKIENHQFKNLVVTILINNKQGDVYIHSTDEFVGEIEKAHYRKCIIPEHLFIKGEYLVTFALGSRDGDLYEKLESVLSFEVVEPDKIESKGLNWKGFLSPTVVKWEF